MNSVQLGAVTCPSCKSTLDAATSMSGMKEHPTPGDLTICADCAAVLYFTDGLGLLAAPPEMIAALPAETQFMLKLAINAVIEMQRGPKLTH